MAGRELAPDEAVVAKQVSATPASKRDSSSPPGGAAGEAGGGRDDEKEVEAEARGGRPTGGSWDREAIGERYERGGGKWTTC